MSFANEVKKELLSLEDVATCCKKAMVLGILQVVVISFFTMVE